MDHDFLNIYVSAYVNYPMSEMEEKNDVIVDINEDLIVQSASNLWFRSHLLPFHEAWDAAYLGKP